LVIVAGENFGCGSSRETSVRALAASGVRAVVARSFARIFFRSLANLGIPPFLCPEAGHGIQEGDVIRIFSEAGFMESAKGSRFPLLPLDPHVEKILGSGGLLSYLQREIHGI
ncbi:MAG: 3-isopropylmalate dehydratase, partial [FCB group bacterium]|nr:3-isopropylmalate dehydratase [FCB group bacterium]